MARRLRQMIKKFLPDGDSQLVAGELMAAEPEQVSGVQGLEVHQLVGHLVVVCSACTSEAGSTPCCRDRLRVRRTNSVSSVASAW